MYLNGSFPVEVLLSLDVFQCLLNKRELDKIKSSCDAFISLSVTDFEIKLLFFFFFYKFSPIKESVKSL